MTDQDQKQLGKTLWNIADQLRIADCLSSLIGAQTQKLDALKTHKKGLMQQLFPSPEEVEA
jgi:type I restriction enzyme S subunit